MIFHCFVSTTIRILKTSTLQDIWKRPISIASYHGRKWKPLGDTFSLEVNLHSLDFVGKVLKAVKSPPVKKNTFFTGFSRQGFFMTSEFGLVPVFVSYSCMTDCHKPSGLRQHNLSQVPWVRNGMSWILASGSPRLKSRCQPAASSSGGSTRERPISELPQCVDKMCFFAAI